MIPRKSLLHMYSLGKQVLSKIALINAQFFFKVMKNKVPKFIYFGLLIFTFNKYIIRNQYQN